VTRLAIVVGAVALVATAITTALLLPDSDSPRFSGEFELSGVTTYEPCLRAPGAAHASAHGTVQDDFATFKSSLSTGLEAASEAYP